MGGIVGAAIGAGIGLLMTAVSDLMQSGDTDPAKIKAVKDAQMQRMQELVDEGIDSGEAYQQAKKETALAMEEAMKVTDNVTGGDYFAAAATGAAMGAIPFGAIAKGASKLGKGAASKVSSFLRKAPTPKADAGNFRSGGRAAAERGSLDRVSPVSEGPNGLRLNGPSTRGVPVGEGVSGPSPMRPKQPPIKDAELWPEDTKIAGNLPLKTRTMDVGAGRDVPALGMADDATLNSIDDIIDAAMSARPARVGYNRPLMYVPRRCFLLETTGG
jgi:hypothetical protein